MNPTYSTDELNQYAIREIFSRVDMERTHRLLGVKSEALDAPENCDPGDCAEYDVLDMRGRPAPWLVQKMKMADDTRILELIDAVNREWA